MRATYAKSKLAPLVVFMLASACSWSSFNDFKNNTPVHAFSNKAFGQLVAISSNPADNTAILATAGNPGDGSRYFQLLDGSADPSGDPFGDQVCTLSKEDVAGGKGCLTSVKLAAVGTLTDLDDATHKSRQRPSCVALGYGKTTSDPTVDFGPIVYCPEGHVFTLGAIDSGADGTKGTGPTLTAAFENHDFATITRIGISFASLPSLGTAANNPPLLMGDEADNAAYIFTEIVAAKPPILVYQPKTANRFGAAVGLGVEAGQLLYVVGAPGAGKVYAFLHDLSKKTVDHVACAGDGIGGTGDSLSVGDVDGDKLDDLVVSQGGGSRVAQVYLGKDLPKTPLTADCGAAWPASTITLRCEEQRGAGNCGQSDFGRAIAIGDLDKDGQNEVAIGAPKASADGTSGAGVVFLYTPSKGVGVADVRYLGRPESGAAFGSDVAIGKVGGEDTLAVASPGKNASYVVWCTNLPGAPSGPRCRK